MGLVAALAFAAPLAQAQPSMVQAPQDAWWLHGGGDPRPVLIHPDAKVTPAQRAHLQRHADLGVDALRRYLWITRGIYNWRLSELLRPGEREA
jgi:hypothetical protein